MTDQTHADWLRGVVKRLNNKWFLTDAGAARLSTIADDLEAKDRTIAALTAERDRLREALSGIIATIESHDFDPIDCDRSGEVYCNCLDRAMDKARAALSPPSASWR